MVTVWTKNTACQELRKNRRHTAATKRKKCHTLRKNTRHTAGTKRKKCHTLRKNTRHTAGTKRKKCHKCYAYTAPTTIQESGTLLKKSMKNRCLCVLHCIVTATQHSLRFATLHV